MTARSESAAQYREYLAPLSRGDELDELLTLWAASQGGDGRNERLRMMASLVEHDATAPLRVLDLFCGPGDVGRAFAERFPGLDVICVDRDPFLLALCTAANQRAGVQSEAHLRDGWQDDWHAPFDGGLDVVAAATALHWLDVPRLGRLFAETRGLLRPRGLLVFDEPASLPPGVSSAGYAGWMRRRNGDLPSGDAWSAFWTYARERFRHEPLLASKRATIGDEGLAPMHYVRLLTCAGFAYADVVHRTGTQVTIAALK